LYWFLNFRIWNDAAIFYLKKSLLKNKPMLNQISNILFFKKTGMSGPCGGDITKADGIRNE
jgi:hypothetical protein